MQPRPLSNPAFASFMPEQIEDEIVESQGLAAGAASRRGRNYPAPLTMSQGSPAKTAAMTCVAYL